MKKAMINYMQTAKNDELYTPAYAVKPLLRHFHEPMTVWCPCDTEDSNIVKVLREAGHRVIATHIKDGYDFFTYEPAEDYDIIITNPPYSIKDEIIERCLQLHKRACLLLPLTALEGIRRGKLWREHGCSVMVLDQRVEFTGKGACWFNTSWFCFPQLINTIIFEEIDK